VHRRAGRAEMIVMRKGTQRAERLALFFVGRPSVTPGDRRPRRQSPRRLLLRDAEKFGDLRHGGGTTMICRSPTTASMARSQNQRIQRAFAG
jgi:hypothetical protein